MFPELGLNIVHVEDVADGILLAYDKGKVGESYVLGGESDAWATSIDRAAAIGGKQAAADDGPAGGDQGAEPRGPLVGP